MVRRTSFLFYKGQKDDINIKGAFLHLMVDALVSLGVIVSGGLIALTGWNIIDPIISFVIAFVILFSTFSTNLAVSTVWRCGDRVPSPPPSPSPLLCYLAS